MRNLPRAVTTKQKLARRMFSAMCAVLCIGVAGAAVVHGKGAAGPVARVKFVDGPSLLEGRELMFDAPAAPRAAAVRHVGRSIRMLVTAYCPCTKCCGPNARGITASGKPVSYHHGRFAAADTDLLPLGSKISIPGYSGGRPVEVIDTGSAIVGNHVDVFFPTHAQALKWGRRWVTVQVD